ncbi:MAG: hypothetical protein BGP06_12975 [Rhizobiales bacterium 65-9]|nr:ImmA/IrrE family metallo-endopeptidase [Hyphomicrobiales bacterium]OJY38936.1 MAG: hypothetical protein BGP06_12975 [Rhizobiales bacterium 65-9]
MSSPIPTRANKAAISAHAEVVARHLNFKPGDSIEALVAKLGGRIDYRDQVGDRLPESMIVRGQTDFTIFLPWITSAERDRFTIAHELGHLFLHYPIARQVHPNVEMIATRWVDESNEDQRRAEWEANWFAGAFLMPAELFSHKYRENPATVPVYFGVSPKAAQIRAKTLGLAT